MTALQLLCTSTAAMNLLFHTTSPDWKPWILITATGLAIPVIVGIEKWLRYTSAFR